MSGAEVVLGVLPLLIAAAEHWDDCIRPFKRYRKFTTEVDRYQQHLKVQYTIFRNQCRILLENVTHDDVVVQTALSERAHPLWTDKEIEQRLASHLAESKDACIATIELIEDRLEGVQSESRDLGAIVAQHQEQALRSLNDDFRNLSSQTSVKHLAVDAPQGSRHYVNKEVQIYRTIGKASRQVYEALGKACTKHTEHLAHFNIKVEHEPCRGAIVPELKFNMAFTHLTLTGMSQLEPIWFMVDSIMEESRATECSTKVPKLDNLSGSLKHSLSQNCPRSEPKKRVRFQSAVSIPATSVLTNTLTSAMMSAPSIRRDFCDYLRRNMSQRPCNPDACRALLEATDGCKHIVYPSPLAVDCTDRPAVSLQQIMSTTSGDSGICTLPQYDRLRLAKALATAVLQYHGTPWLKLTWRSRDVVFFNYQKAISNRDTPDLSVPHLNVKVKGPAGQDSQPICVSNNLAPNPVLFGLGVMLLEIAHSRPLQSLQEPKDLVNGPESDFSEFFTAKRLSNSLGREMGSSYGKIVKKLLQCDFGCGDDLNDPALQAGYYHEVVCELDRLEQGFRKLQLGI